MPKFNDFELDLQNQNFNSDLQVNIRSFFNCDEELTIRPCYSDYYYCEPRTLDELKHY